MMRARVVLSLLLCAVTAGTAGCGVLARIPHIPVMVQNGGIVFGTKADAAKLTGGETVLAVANDSDLERQIVLAHLPGGWPGEVPAELLAAETIRDDGRIMGMTNPLEARELEAEGAGFAFVRASHTFHVHLRPNDTYVLFDRLGNDGLVVVLVPGPGGAS